MENVLLNYIKIYILVMFNIYKNKASEKNYEIQIKCTTESCNGKP